MKRYNCIVVFDLKLKNVLFCKRVKEPYKDRYNFVGGKREEGESGFESAYRELYEETGIVASYICLTYFMEINYEFLGYCLELYCGVIDSSIQLKAEINPLEWKPITSKFDDVNIFAGDQNIGHIIRMAQRCLENKKELDKI